MTPEQRKALEALRDDLNAAHEATSGLDAFTITAEAEAGAGELREVAARLLEYAENEADNEEWRTGSTARPEPILAMRRLLATPAPEVGEPCSGLFCPCCDAVSAAIGTSRWMDPPDGGGVALAEQVRRMREHIDRLEAQPATDALRGRVESVIAEAMEAGLGIGHYRHGAETMRGWMVRRLRAALDAERPSTDALREAELKRALLVAHEALDILDALDAGEEGHE